MERLKISPACSESAGGPIRATGEKDSPIRKRDLTEGQFGGAVSASALSGGSVGREHSMASHRNDAD